MQQQPGVGAGCFIVALIITLLMGALAAVGYVRHIEGMVIFFGIAMLLALAGLIWGALALQQQSMVDVVVEVTPLELAVGERLKVSATVTAKRRAPLTRGRFVLRCQERAINRGGTSDTTYTHLAHEEVLPLEAGQSLSEMSSWTGTGEFTIPVGLPGSFSGRNNFIEWSVGFDMGLSGPLLDIRRSQAIIVRNVRR